MTAALQHLESDGSPGSVLDRIAAIMDAFGAAEELTLAQVVRESNLPRSSVHRMLQRMVALEWVERRGYRYRLGVRMRELGNQVFMQDKVHRAAIRRMYELRDETGLDVHLLTLAGTDAVTLETVWGRSSLPTLAPSRYSAHATAGGKILLACLPREQRAALIQVLELRPYTRATVTSPRRLAEELERIREAEVAYARQELRLGITSVAVPVGPAALATTALSVSGNVERVNAETAARSLRRAAAATWDDASVSRPARIGMFAQRPRRAG